MSTHTITETRTKLRGVNLGGWLVLEKWMTPSLFNGLRAEDEYGLCEELLGEKYSILENHRKSFIQEDDFQWLSAHGINAVRIPVGHWIFDGQAPYVAAIEYLDNAMQWATAHKLKVIIDFHAAPGSQNGQDHSGKAGAITWHKQPELLTRSLDVIEQLTKRYKDNPSLYGIELLNEPHRSIPLSVLAAYYQAGYARVRKHLDDSVAVIISDGFRPLRKWRNVMTEPDYSNVILDTHLYQAFGFWNRWRRLRGHIRRSRKWQTRLEKFAALRPIIVGEWSLAVASKTYRNLNEAASLHAHQRYAQSQLEAFESADGNFFWSYKTEGTGEWNFRSCYEKGFLG